MNHWIHTHLTHISAFLLGCYIVAALHNWGIGA